MRFLPNKLLPLKALKVFFSFGFRGLDFWVCKGSYLVIPIVVHTIFAYELLVSKMKLLSDRLPVVANMFCLNVLILVS